MSMVGFPLLLIPLAIYNIIVFLMPGVTLAEPLLTLPLMSGATWPVTLSDILLTLGIWLLLFEIVKGARPGAKYLTDHLLSLLVFCAAAAEFMLLPRFGSSTYFLLTMLALVDFLAGVVLRARRGVARAPAGIPSAAPEPITEPEFDAVPAPGASVPPEGPEATTTRSDVGRGVSADEVASPGLQPGQGSQPR
jgi:hypothetical protein